MSKAEICPVCNGGGKLKDNMNDYDYTGTPDAVKTCHGCGGQGWIVIKEEYIYSLI